MERIGLSEVKAETDDIKWCRQVALSAFEKPAASQRGVFL
jgi:hypothetical protein